MYWFVNAHSGTCWYGEILCEEPENVVQEVGWPHRKRWADSDFFTISQSDGVVLLSNVCSAASKALFITLSIRHLQVCLFSAGVSIQTILLLSPVRRWCSMVSFLAHRPLTKQTFLKYVARSFQRLTVYFYCRSRVRHDWSSMEGNFDGSWARFRLTHEHERSALQRRYATDSRVAERQLS